MKKYNTRPINFTGCHPVIAEALKRGEEIECWVWNDNTLPKKAIMTVTGYEIGGGYPYRIATCMNSRYAEPTPLKTRRIMPPERAIRALIEDGWEFSDNGNLVGNGNSVLTGMFKLMGKPLSDPKVSVWAWPDCIIEEAEDDE